MGRGIAVYQNASIIDANNARRIADETNFLHVSAGSRG
jgi:hypothetical protein